MSDAPNQGRRIAAVIFVMTEGDSVDTESLPSVEFMTTLLSQ